MQECSKCRSAVRGESGVRCAGVCGKIFHTNVKCSGLDQYSSNVLDTNKMIKFMCDDCVQYIQNVDLIVKEMQDSVIQNSNYLKEYKIEFESTLKKNENEIKELLEKIEGRYFERIKVMKSTQESCEKSVEEIKNMCQNFSRSSEQLSKDLDNNKKENERITTEVKKIINNSTTANTQMSYAGAVRKNVNNVKVMPELRKEVPLIVKPKNKQMSEKTKNDLNQNVDPKNLKISNIESRHNGIVIIESDNNDEREKIKKLLENKMKDDYEIKIPSSMNPRIVVVNMGYKHDDLELIEKLKKQNQILENSSLKLIKQYEIKRNNRKLYNAIIEVDPGTFPKVIAKEKVCIGWERCKVFDGVEILMCFKCKGFNHKAADCKNEETCTKCLGKHKTRECNKDQVLKCINCLRANEKLNLKLDDNHATFSKQCPVYQNKLNIKRNRIGY